MADRPRLLDLFCGAGGASMGYYRAGFDVVGVDIAPQPNYPFEFIQADALKYMETRYCWGWFDAIHASPPCQAYTQAQRLQGNDHPELIAPTRRHLRAAGLPYVIENVLGAPLREPVELCGTMFGLGVLRHRLFESNAPLPRPEHPKHRAPQRKMGRVAEPYEYIQPVGNFAGVDHARAAMGIHWMTRDELAEAIPPAFTEWVGRRLFGEALQQRRLAL